MKKNLIVPFLAALTLAFCTIFISCDSDISLELLPNADGSTSLSVSFSGSCGDAFKEMLLAASGASASGADGSGGLELFDSTEISTQLENAGFSSIAVSAKGVKLSISMKDAECKTYLFTSGLLEQSAKKLKLHLSQSKLKAFYTSSDEQIQMLLDLFLAPVFNDESMSTSEYLELVGAVYGEAAQKEVTASTIHLSVKNADGTISRKNILLAEVLCGKESNW